MMIEGWLYCSMLVKLQACKITNEQGTNELFVLLVGCTCIIC